MADNLTPTPITDNMSQEEAAKMQPLMAEPWLLEVEASEKWMKQWHSQGRRITKRFLDRRDGSEEKQKKLNLFTVNTKILLATLYGRFPKPMVVREYEDEDDDIARVAAIIMERCLKVRRRDDFDSAVRNVVQDRLVPGMGTVWLRYEPTIETKQAPAIPAVPPTIDELGNVLDEGVPEVAATSYDEIVDEKVATDYVFWEDIRISPARTWDKVRWVGRKVKLSKEDAEARFGPDMAGKLRYTKTPGDQGEAPDEDNVEYACVYEIWVKKSRCVYWVSPGFEFILDKKEDPLKLTKFWPMPKPLMALHSTSNFIPRPDYLLAQDQYDGLDNLEMRIWLLETAIRVVGVADGSSPVLEQIFNGEQSNKMITMRNFSEFAEKGGFKGAVDWMPLDVIVQALEKLRQQRQDKIQQIYEVTGISDIIRGSTKATETATAQQLKAQYGSVGLQFLQGEVASFVEEALEIKSEIIVNHFQPETIARISNIMGRKADAPFAEAAMALLKDPASFAYRVEVNADSMAVPEFTAERDGRMQYVRAVGEMLTAAAPLGQTMPGMIPALLKILAWAAASFRTGQTIESVLDEAIAMVTHTIENPTPPTPDPEKEAKVGLTNAQTAKTAAEAEGQIIENEHTAIIGPVPPKPPSEDGPPAN
jgi:hypothetical protein